MPEGAMGLDDVVMVALGLLALAALGGLAVAVLESLEDVLPLLLAGAALVGVAIVLLAFVDGGPGVLGEALDYVEARWADLRRWWDDAQAPEPEPTPFIART